mmetsp:Transcript_9052/g.17726  ORF Transcript_9052/g.17726 Transcript_9052/m.17726 type:complete len:108 (-) Transcript_9052:37-360(-)
MEGRQNQMEGMVGPGANDASRMETEKRKEGREAVERHGRRIKQVMRRRVGVPLKKGEEMMRRLLTLLCLQPKKRRVRGEMRLQQSRDVNTMAFFCCSFFKICTNSEA